MLAAAVVATSCVAIPMNVPNYDITPEQQATLKPGVTTRADILFRFGIPDIRFDGDRVIGYHWKRDRALVIFVTGGAVGAWDNAAILLEFDASGTLLRTKLLDAWRAKDLMNDAGAWAKDAGRRPATP